MENPVIISILIGFGGLVITLISASWLTNYQFRDSLRQLEKRIEDFDKHNTAVISEMDKRISEQFAQVKTEIKSFSEIYQIKLDALDNKSEARFQSLDEKSESRFQSLAERIDALDIKSESRFQSLEERIDLRYQSLEERIDLRYQSLEERMEANKAELKAEILAVKSDLSFSYNEKLDAAVENRIIKLEQNILPRIERLEREAA